MTVEYALKTIPPATEPFSMLPEPTALSLLPDGKLAIEWSDGRRRRYEIGELRRKCPCATCMYERDSAPRTVDPPEDSPPVTLEQVHPVGNYAYNIRFSDGHSTGIFPLGIAFEVGGGNVGQVSNLSRQFTRSLTRSWERNYSIRTYPCHSNCSICKNGSSISSNRRRIGMWIYVILGGLAVLIRLDRRLADSSADGGKAEKPLPPELRIELAKLINEGPPADLPVLEFYNLPMRLAGIVLAPVGRLRELPPPERIAGSFRIGPAGA